MDKSKTEILSLESYEQLFDSVSLKLYSYAVFSLKDEGQAEELVSLAYAAGFKSLLLQKKKNLESVLFMLVTKGIIDKDNDAMVRCAIYLLFKLKWELKRVADVLSVSPFLVRELLKTAAKDIKQAV